MEQTVTLPLPPRRQNGQGRSGGADSHPTPPRRQNGQGRSGGADASAAGRDEERARADSARLRHQGRRGRHQVPPVQLHRARYRPHQRQAAVAGRPVRRPLRVCARSCVLNIHILYTYVTGWRSTSACRRTDRRGANSRDKKGWLQ